MKLSMDFVELFDADINELLGGTTDDGDMDFNSLVNGIALRWRWAGRVALRYMVSILPNIRSWWRCGVVWMDVQLVFPVEIWYLELDIRTTSCFEGLRGSFSFSSTQSLWVSSLPASTASATTSRSERRSAEFSSERGSLGSIKLFPTSSEISWMASSAKMKAAKRSPPCTAAWYWKTQYVSLIQL